MMALNLHATNSATNSINLDHTVCSIQKQSNSNSFLYNLIKALMLDSFYFLQIFLVFVVAAIMILGYCSDIKGTSNYQDVVHSVCGPWAQLACAVSITLYCFGTCITFLIIIGDQWQMCELVYLLLGV